MVLCFKNASIANGPLAFPAADLDVPRESKKGAEPADPAELVIEGREPCALFHLSFHVHDACVSQVKGVAHRP